MYNKGLEIFDRKVKEKWQNSSENYKRDNFSLVLSRVPAQKCFSKHFFLDGLSLMDCGISFQKKLPKNLLR